MRELDTTGEGKRAEAVATIWAKSLAIYEEYPGERELLNAHEFVGRCEQQDQSDKANGVWISRLRIFFLKIKAAFPGKPP